MLLGSLQLVPHVQMWGPASDGGPVIKAAPPLSDQTRTTFGLPRRPGRVDALLIYVVPRYGSAALEPVQPRLPSGSRTNKEDDLKLQIPTRQNRPEGRRCTDNKGAFT